jgi:hypothetical protein
MTWRMRHFHFAVALTMVATALLTAVTAAEKNAFQSTTNEDVPTLSDQTYEKWFRYVAPDTKAHAWRKIGWRTSFYEALKEAQKTQRPILLWVMNGHPCGSV